KCVCESCRRGRSGRRAASGSDLHTPTTARRSALTMSDIVKSSPICNGNGTGEINGRGVLRRKLTRQQRISLAADVALGLVHVEPSMKQSAATVGVRPDEVRAELKARAAVAAAAERERQAEQAEYTRQ